MFRLKVAEMGLKEVFEIRAPQNQPILDALQADARLEKIKKKIPKIYLHPDGKTTVKGIPNIGSPCSVIEGGRFEARFGKDQNCNMYSDDELKCSERYKIYLDVRNRKNKTKWLTRRNPNSFDFPILVDCLPNDTLLTALLRDVRIDNERVRYTKLICKDSAGEINIKLTDKSSFHHDSVFTCHVLKTSQVSDQEWGKGCAGQYDRIYQTTGMSDSKKISTEIENIDPQVEIAMSGTDSSGSLQKDKVTLEVKKIIHGSQTQVAELLKVDFEQKESSNAERKRKRKLDQFAEPYRQDFYNANKGISVLLVEKLGKLARSVGVLVKNGNPYGTCFRLGSKYVMTNSHVTEMAEMAGICSNAFVFLNYKKSRDFDKQPSEDLLEFKVLRVVCSSQVGDLDYSLLELDIPDDQAERLPIGVGHKIVKQAQQNTTVTIIGHPGGRPKKVDPSCPVVGPNHRITVYLKFHPELWDDYAMVYDAKRNNYMSGFGSGASGSPGFDEDGNLVVMHACGYHLYDRSKTEVEQGVRMTAIRDDLKQHLPADLWDDLFLPPTESMEVD
ncbi:uncharacterized protein LOC118418474 [Branchiostoma floridae]|uniref:Uncharacterized protein LOC118418474 n=1 Tax=Branchiostoma floridae TaxID=7739 RepID=A0A9J7LE32_BRAFL|nr:uncharacterized protein LOC118418474 [Branchiostoma floridae]